MNSFKRINSSALAELIVQRKTHIISLILLGISGLTYLNTTMSEGSEPEPYFMSLIFFFISLFPLFIACVEVFRDMHDVPTADVQMAMPLSARERFLSRLMTIGYIWFFPFILFSAFGSISSAFINHFFIDKYLVPAPIPEMIAENLSLILIGISISLFIICVTVLSACCIGSKAEAFYLPGILMITVSVLPFETVDFIQTKYANVSTNRSLSQLIYAFGFSTAFQNIAEPLSLLIILLNCFISLLLIFIAMHAYEKRDAQSVGYPVVFRSFFEVVLGSSLIALFMLIHGSNYGVELIPIFIFFIGSLILRMIVSRKDISIIKVVKWSAMFAVYYVFFIVFSYTACITGGFGMKNQTPDTSSLSSKAIYYCTIESYNDSYYLYDYDDTNYDDTKNTEITKGQIKEITEICTDYIEKQNSAKNYFTDSVISGFYKYNNDYKIISVSISYQSGYSGYMENIYNAKIRLSEDQTDKLREKILSAISSQ